MDKAKKKGVTFYLPVDCVVANAFEANATNFITPVQEIPEGWMALDIGPASAKLFGETLRDAKTVIWNGPMGVFEIEQTAKGTFAVAHIMADITSAGAVTVIGGGDSAAAIEKAGMADRVSHVSTGGGASLEFLEGRELPGIAALQDRPGADGKDPG